MTAIYYKNADGKYIRDDDGKYMRGEPGDCCCEDPCCGEEGGPPTAGFSYSATAGNPCTIDLHNESTPGTCGSIVAYRWLLNGVEFSTDSDPTDVEVADGDDITLTVTDVAGCTDSVVMEIDCPPCANAGECYTAPAGCDQLLPATATAIIPDFFNNPGDPGLGGCTTPCSVIGGSYTLNRDGTNCLYGIEIEQIRGEDCYGNLNIQALLVTTTDTWRVRVSYRETLAPGSPFTTYEYTASIPLSGGCPGKRACRGTFVCTGPTVVGGSGTVDCEITTPGSVTLIV